MNVSIFIADSIKDLYDYLLNREYADPLALEHQMERKAVRSPSLRLRFGRRSDPDVLLRVTISRHNYLSFISFVYFIFKQDNEIDNEVEQKPIRSPSLRLRFGKRFGNDPMMSLFNEVYFLYPFKLQIVFIQQCKYSEMFYIDFYFSRIC